VILVFGGDGQLGQELVRAASNRSIALAALNRSEVDIADATAVAWALENYRPELVVNAAGYTRVDLAEAEIEQAHQGNEIGPSLLAKACAVADIPLIHVSTDYVFDGTKNDAYTESDPVCPINVYGRTKALGEAAVRHSLAHHVILRTAWLYGEFGHNFLKTIVGLARTRDELRVVADQMGNPTSTSQLADAVLRIWPRMLTRDIDWGTYHFTSAGVTTWHGFASRIVSVLARLTGHNPKVIPISSSECRTAARRPLNSTLNCTRFARAFGFRAGPWSEEAEAVTRALVAREGGMETHVA
jgi:dTDP-4-dehydrorhamnose reductase